MRILPVLISRLFLSPRTILAGIAAFLNHSCSPNCRFIRKRYSRVEVQVSVDSEQKILFFSFVSQTLREIEPGEELTVEYANSLCHCSSCTAARYKHDIEFKRKVKIMLPKLIFHFLPTNVSCYATTIPFINLFDLFHSQHIGGNKSSKNSFE